MLQSIVVGWTTERSFGLLRQLSIVYLLEFNVHCNVYLCIVVVRKWFDDDDDDDDATPGWLLT